MIPVRLELTNFLSYRETAVLDFGGIHVAGIAGPNGAGKSSIMEAMTWALFGQSRVRSDDDLVNRQAEDKDAAEVRFTFELEGVIYRIIRRKRPGKTMILELQMDAGDGTWKPLSEGKIRETQAAIEALLRMNYESFINASFLLQGKADQFTTRTASQRKEILAELLGVTQWDQYRERAAAARKEVEGNVALLDARLVDIITELEEEPERIAALDETKAQHQAIVDKRDLKELLLTETRLKEETRRQQRKNIASAETRVERMQLNLQRTVETLASRNASKEQLDETIKLAEQISAAYVEWQSADKEVQQHQALAARHNEISQAMQPYKVQLAEARSRLEQQQQALLKQAARVESANQDQARLVVAIAESNKELQSLEQESDQLSRLEAELGKAREQLQHAGGERKLWRQELDKLESQARRMDQAAAEKTAAAKAKEETTELIVTLDEKIAVISEQQQTYSQLQAEEQALKAQRPDLKSNMQRLSERIADLESAELEDACPLCDQPLSEEHRHTVLETLREEGKGYGDAYRANESRLKALQVELPQVEKTLQQGSPLERERQAQQMRLAQADARLEEIARTESEWAESGEKRLVELAAALADTSAFDAVTARVAELESSLRGKAAHQQQLQELQQRQAADRARLNETQRLLDEWESEGSLRLAETTDQLQSESFAQEARQELATLEEQSAEVGYDAAAHQAFVKKREEVSDAPRRYQALNEARAALQPLQDAIDDLEKQIAQQTDDLQDQQQQRDLARQQLSALESDGIDLKALESDVFNLREQVIAAAQQVGASQQKLDVLQELREMQRGLLDQKEALSLRGQRLTLLEKSCGRKGVQALLIEHALPEIEDSANELLDRLTGGEMSIKFDTQRQLKSRDALAETLDIIISDRAGERPYDNYSGGEQFRINFAIRLALSQLLAQRAGARLQTLVIDEGFGSQDPQGRQRLIEAINAVQDDFACVLVITHIEELREVFPTRIEVLKEQHGSQIYVN